MDQRQRKNGSAGKKQQSKKITRQRLVDYLSDPGNEWPSRVKMGLALGYSRGNYIYGIFSPTELDEIETEARSYRVTRYGDHLSKIDLALAKSAKKGDTAAAKLFYQRMEGWSEKTISEQKIEHKGLGLSPEALLKALKEKDEGQKEGAKEGDKE